MLGHPAAGIRNSYNKPFFFFCYSNAHYPVRTVVSYGVFGKIKEQTIDQRVTADHGTIACTFKDYSVLLCERCKVGKNLLNHRGNLYAIVTRHRPKLAHLKQSFCHLRHPLGLLT